MPTPGLEGVGATDEHSRLLSLGNHSDVVLAFRLISVIMIIMTMIIMIMIIISFMIFTGLQQHDDDHHHHLCDDIGSTLDLPFIVHNSASLASAGQLIR